MSNDRSIIIESLKRLRKEAAAAKDFVSEMHPIEYTKKEFNKPERVKKRKKFYRKAVTTALATTMLLTASALVVDKVFFGKPETVSAETTELTPEEQRIANIPIIVDDLKVHSGNGDMLPDGTREAYNHGHDDCLVPKKPGDDTQYPERLAEYMLEQGYSNATVNATLEMYNDYYFTNSTDVTIDDIIALEQEAIEKSNNSMTK